MADNILGNVKELINEMRTGMVDGSKELLADTQVFLEDFDVKCNTLNVKLMGSYEELSQLDSKEK